MDTEENELIVNNMGLAYELALKYYNKIQHAIELDELQSIAFLGLVKAGNTFNKDLQFAFSTYAYNCIRNEIVKHISYNIHNTTQSIYTQIGEDLELQDVLVSEINVEYEFIIKELTDTLKDKINTLPDIYRTILLYKLNGYTFNEISKMVGLSISQTNQYYHKAVNILRYRLKDWRERL